MMRLNSLTGHWALLCMVARSLLTLGFNSAKPHLFYETVRDAIVKEVHVLRPTPAVCASLIRFNHFENNHSMIYYTYIRKCEEWELILETYNEDDYTPIPMNGLDEFSVVFHCKMTKEVKAAYNEIIKSGFDPALRTSSTQDHWVVAINKFGSDISLITKPCPTPYEALILGIEEFEKQLLTTN